MRKINITCDKCEKSIAYLEYSYTYAVIKDSISGRQNFELCKECHEKLISTLISVPKIYPMGSDEYEAIMKIIL